MKKIIAAFGPILFTLVPTTWAAPLSNVPLPGGSLNAEYTVGSGANLSLVIVDFGDTGGGSYAFGYRWNTPTDFGAAINAIANEGPSGQSLNADIIDDPTYGAYVNNFAYGSNSGNPDDFWRLEVGTYTSGGITWNTSETGLSSLTTDNFSASPTLDTDTYLGTAGVIGFYNSFDDDSIKPRSPLAVSAAEKGDFNLNGHVDASGISAMLSALADLSAYQNGSNSQNAFLSNDNLLTLGDLNGDGTINNADLQYLLNLLKSGGGSTSVPEPASYLLLASGGLALLRRAKMRKDA
jgi:hypothetical protein